MTGVQFLNPAFFHQVLGHVKWRKNEEKTHKISKKATQENDVVAVQKSFFKTKEKNLRRVYMKIKQR